MCDPVSLGVLTIAAGVLTAGAQVYGGMAANAQGKYEQKIANRNAQLEREAVKDAQHRDEIEQQRHWRRVAAALGQQTAEAAGLGLDVNFGSPAQLQEDTMMIGYEDATTINENFAKEIKGYDINASNYVAQGRAARARGKAAMVGGVMSGLGTILGTASQIGGKLATPSPSGGGGSSYDFGASYTALNQSPWSVNLGS